MSLLPSLRTALLCTAALLALVAGTSVRTRSGETPATLHALAAPAAAQPRPDVDPGIEPATFSDSQPEELPPTF